MNTRVQQDEVTSHFDRTATSYGRKYDGKSARAHSFRVRQERVCQLFDKPGGKVLDIGCGPGIMVGWLLDQGCEVHGVDIAPQMVGVCRQMFGVDANVQISVGAIERLPYEDNTFDSVLCLGVVEYVDDDHKAVEEMARVTRPGGSVIITLPSALSPWRLWGAGLDNNKN